MKIIASAFAVATAIVAIWGASVIFAQTPTKAGVAVAPRIIGTMEMMSQARDLPEEQFDSI